MLQEDVLNIPFYGGYTDQTLINAVKLLDTGSMLKLVVCLCVVVLSYLAIFCPIHKVCNGEPDVPLDARTGEIQRWRAVVQIVVAIVCYSAFVFTVS